MTPGRIGAAPSLMHGTLCPKCRKRGKKHWQDLCDICYQDKLVRADIDRSCGRKNFSVSYRHNGQVYNTVVAGFDLAEAQARFVRENPHVEVVTG